MARTEYDYQFGHHDAILDKKLTQHLSSLNNPHRVTATQVGLSKVKNIAPEDMPLSTETKEYVDRFVKSIKIEQNFEKSIVYIYALDASGEILNKEKIDMTTSGGIAKYDSLGNEIVSTYASKIVVKVEENQSYACLISSKGDEISRIPVCDSVSITEMVFDSETYTLKLIKSDGSEITCTLSSIYDNLIAYVDAEIKKVDDKLSEEVSRASAKESELKSAIDTEVERAKATENTKVDKSAYETKIEELSQVDSGLAEDLEAEVTARENLKSDLDTFKGTVYTKTETENKIDEKIAAIDISDKLKEVKDEIEAETARAEKAESDLQDNIDSLDEAKQDKLTAGDNITIENNVISATGVSQKYVDDKVKEYVDEKIPEVKEEFKQDLEDLSARLEAEAKDRSDGDKSLAENKQDKITDLVTIREGAALGATAVQPDELTDYVKSEKFEEELSKKANTTHNHTKSDITDFPEMMPASDVHEWAKAENKPTYTYEEVGAAAKEHNHDSEYSKLDHNHDDRYIKEESDPVFKASPAAGIKQEDINKWNNGMTSVSWDDVQDKPKTFTPSEHTHDQYLQESDLEGYATEQWVEGKGYLTEHQDISGKADKADTYTKTETETKISEHHDSTKQDKLTAGRNITIEDNIISATGGGEGSSDYTLDVQQVTDYIGNQLPESLISTNPTLYVNGNLSKEEIIEILDKLFKDIPDNFNQYNVTRTREIDIKGCFFIFRNASKWPITGEKVEVQATGEPLQYLIWMYDGTYQRVWTPERCKITGENVISYVNGNTWSTFDPTHDWEGSKNILSTVLSGSVTGNGYFRNEDSEELSENRNSLLTSLFSFGFTFKIIVNEPHLLLKNDDEIKSDVNLQKHLVTQDEKSVNIREINESLGFELYSNEINDYENQIFCIISWNKYSTQTVRSQNNDKLIDIINKLKDFCSTKKIIGYWQKDDSKVCDAVSIQIKNISYTKDQIEIILSNPLGVEECKYLHTIEYISSDKNIINSIESSKEFGDIKLAFKSSIFIEGKNYLDIKIDTTIVTSEIKDFLKYLVGNTSTINGGYQTRSGIVLVDKEGKYDETSTVPCKITTNSTTKTISRVDIIKSVNKLFKGEDIWLTDEDCKAPTKIYLNSNVARNDYWDASQVQQSFGRCILNTINYAIFLSDNFEEIKEPGTLFLVVLNKLDQSTKGYLYLPSGIDLFPRGWYELTGEGEIPIKELENPEVELPASDENDILWAETLVNTPSISPSGLDNYNSFTDSLNNIIQLTNPTKYDNALFFNGLDKLIEFKKIKNNSIFSDELSNNISIPDSIKYLNIKSDPTETAIKNPLVDGMNVETLYINTNANVTNLCNNIPWIDAGDGQKMYPIFSNEDGTVQGMLMYLSQGVIVEVFGVMIQINEIAIQVLYVLSGGDIIGGIPDHTWLKSSETGDMELVNYEEPINGNTPIGIIMMMPGMGEDVINMLSHLFSGNESFEGENVEGLGLIDTNENITKPSDLLPIKTINGNSIIGSGNIVIGGEVDPEQIKELIEAALAPYKAKIEELEATVKELTDAHSMEENE